MLPCFAAKASDIATQPQETSLLTSLVQNASNANALGQFQVAAQVARACVLPDNAGYATNINWKFDRQADYYTTPAGTQYLLRAREPPFLLNICIVKQHQVTWSSVLFMIGEDNRFIPQPLPVSEVVYFQTNVDSTGATLDSSTGNNYTITFPLPIPAMYFWSLIIYNATSLNLTENHINCYSVSDRVRPLSIRLNRVSSNFDAVVQLADLQTPGLVYSTKNSSLTAYISSTAPPNGTVAYSNWIPAPSNAPFFSILRIYGAQGPAFVNQYAPLAFVILSSSGGAAATG